MPPPAWPTVVHTCSICFPFLLHSQSVEFGCLYMFTNVVVKCALTVTFFYSFVYVLRHAMRNVFVINEVEEVPYIFPKILSLLQCNAKCIVRTYNIFTVLHYLNM